MFFVFFFCLFSIIHGQINNLSCPPSKESIEQMILDTKIPGMAIVVINRTHTLYKQGFGYTTPPVVSTDEPIDPDQSIFPLGSISKTFIAVAAMKLVESGLLDLDQNINAYLPKKFAIFHPKFPRKPITMKHLLSHTSSIGPNTEKELTHFVPGDDFTKTNIGELVKDFVSNQSNWLSTPPGTNTSYSNVATTLAAFVIEQIARVSFESFVEYHILRRLGLKVDQASYRLSDFRGKESKVVKHYIFNASLIDDVKALIPQLTMKKAENGADWFYIEPYGVKNYPAGTLRMSANSLSIYLQDFLNKFPSVLSKSTSTDQMTEIISKIEGGPQFGLSWYWDKVNNRRFLGHRGTILAVATVMATNEKQNVGVIILTNGELNASETIGSAVYKTINDLLVHLFDCFE